MKRPPTQAQRGLLLELASGAKPKPLRDAWVLRGEILPLATTDALLRRGWAEHRDGTLTLTALGRKALTKAQP